MNKYKIIIEYDGTNYVGWQKQENGNSIQQIFSFFQNSTSFQNNMKKLHAKIQQNI